ncbi:cytochrome P450 [Chelativorans sp. ZYF759]|uniref:cytochrome P450 n=1 Tax=Chelativorans sp. ZYF759 TaxID=2692213 RepID=UPI00145F4FB5|nr:cytochrome P450 [Chelativorans sp. ZYF759]NMG41699.1 cytochrome P450 [Chelativorans sp. ZYF759]
MLDSKLSASIGQPFSIKNVEDIEPWEYYEALRGDGPIVWDTQMNAWAVLGFEECAFIEMNEDRFRNPYQTVPPVVVEIKGGGRNITLLSGEEHMRMRRFFLKLMTPPLVEGYRNNQVAPTINMLMKRILAKGTGKADLTAEFGDQIPPRVIAALLGMPWEDDAMVARILHLHEEIMEVIGSGFATEDIRQKGLRVSKDINDMLLPYIRDRKANPRDDFISRVWTEAPSEFGDDLTEEDVVAICRELFLGGADTTVHGIANILYLVLTNADIRAAVEADRKTALSSAVEESMRLYGSVMYRFRVANDDCTIAGTEVKRDQRLILLHSAANRDPGKYACPHAADLARKPAADHLAFNKGPRSCVGMGLARAEMRDAVSAVLDNLSNVRLDPEAEQPGFKSLFMRSWRPLNVVFDVAR